MRVWPLLLQKVHVTDILNGKRETKRNNPKMHVKLLLARVITYTHTLSFTGLAPRIFFIFAPLLREEGGGGAEGRGFFL